MAKKPFTFVNPVVYKALGVDFPHREYYQGLLLSLSALFPLQPHRFYRHGQPSGLLVRFLPLLTDNPTPSILGIPLEINQKICRYLMVAPRYIASDYAVWDKRKDTTRLTTAILFVQNRSAKKRWTCFTAKTCSPQAWNRKTNFCAPVS